MPRRRTMNDLGNGTPSGGVPVPVLIFVVLVVVALQYLLSENQSHHPVETSKLLRLDTTTTTAMQRGSLYGQGHKPLNDPLPPLPRMPTDTKTAVAEVMQMILEARAATNSRASFLQIGANDGQMYDPLYPYFKETSQKQKWLGLQVEPQPTLFGSLCVLHADAPDWSFYQGAIASPEVCRGGKVKFCETKTPGEGDWRTQGQVNGIRSDCDRGGTLHFQQRPCVTSFDDLIYQHAKPLYLQTIMEVIPQGSGKSFKRKFHLDLLQIDLEGKDYDVLKLIDWDLLSPACINYERTHLDPEKDQAAKDLVRGLGYTIFNTGDDILACKVAKNG